MAEMKMLDMIEQSDRPPNRNEKPESCYCSALPKGQLLDEVGRLLAGGRSAHIELSAIGLKRCGVLPNY
jgi:hypothetical protein